MNNDNIQKIEQALQVVLPEDYKKILLQYPREISDARDLHLADDVNWLIEQNLYVREDPSNFFGKEAWCPNHFIIGEDGNGNCFYLNLEKPLPSPIFLLDHTTPDSDDQEIACSFDAWIPQVREQLAEYRKNAEQRRQNEERKPQKTKPWWRFW